MIIYKWFEKISLSPAWELVPRCFVELQDKGFLDGPSWWPDWNSHVVVAFNEHGCAIGFIAYTIAEHTAKASICGAWVNPESRGIGVHSEMFAAMVRKLEADENVTEIVTMTHAANVAAQSAFLKQGRVLVGYQYRYIVSAPKEGIEV